MDTFFRMAPYLAVLSIGFSLLGAGTLSMRLPLRIALRGSAVLLALLVLAPALLLFRPPGMALPILFPDSVVEVTSEGEVVALPRMVETEGLRFASWSLPSGRPGRWSVWAGCVWLAIGALLIGNTLWQVLRLALLCRHLRPLDGSLPGPVSVMTMNTGGGPFSFWWKRPVLVVPQDWSHKSDEKGLRLALEHERAHLSHGDFWIMLAWRLGRLRNPGRLTENEMTMTKTQKSMLGILAAGALLFAGGCACLAPAKARSDTKQLRASARESIDRKAQLGAGFEKRSELLKDTADEGAEIAFEVKFFEHDGKVEEKRPAIEVLDADESRKRIENALSDRKTTTVAYPRVLTKTGKLVSIESVVNQPILTGEDAKTKTDTGELIPVGTSIVVCPTLLRNGKVDLNFALMISEIIGNEIVEGNKFPVVSTRHFDTIAKLDKGETLWIRGEGEKDSRVRDPTLDIAVSWARP